MSDAPGGPDWWRASDGKWYPPESTPGTVPPPPPLPPPPAWGDDIHGVPDFSNQQTAGKATGSLVAAIASFVVCPIVAAIVSLVLAFQAKREIRESRGRLGGSGLATTSIVLSIINLVLIVPLMLLGIAIPTFLGARERAQDRMAQSELRNGLVAAKVIYTDARNFGTAEQMQSIEPSIDFQQGDLPLPGVVTVQGSQDTVILSTRAKSDKCFYVIHNAVSGQTGYAEDEGCRPASAQRYLPSWA